MIKNGCLVIMCVLSLSACEEPQNHIMLNAEELAEDENAVREVEAAILGRDTDVTFVNTSSSRDCYTSTHVRIALRLLRDAQIRAALQRRDPDLILVRDETCGQIQEIGDVADIDYLDSGINDNPVYLRIEEMTPDDVSHLEVISALVDISEGRI